MKFAERNFGKWSHKALGLDAKSQDRARKVVALVNGGATAGERSAAMSRLTAIADQAGVTADRLLAAL